MATVGVKGLIIYRDRWRLYVSLHRHDNFLKVLDSFSTIFFRFLGLLQILLTAA